MPASARQLIIRTTLILALATGLWAGLLWSAGGGFELALAGVNIKSHDPSRPLLVCLLAVFVGAIAAGPRKFLDQAFAFLIGVEKTAAAIRPWTVALVMALAVFTVGVVFNTRTAGGSDSYGYVSQDELWLKGDLTIEQPWVSRVPWPGGTWSFSPLGYMPQGVRRDGRIEDHESTIVPTYSPGLPMVMALAKGLAGQCALYGVVPVFGGVLVLATYGIGLRLGSRQAGLIAAWLVATSPMMLFMDVQPMSDVPAAAAMAVSLWCLLGKTVKWSAAAGAAVALLVLIRPNLVPVAAIMAGWLMLRAWKARPGERMGWLRRAVLFSCAVAPAAVVVASINSHLYGSPLRNGYGALGDLFAWTNVPINLRYYTRIFIETQTVFALLGVVALALPPIWRRTHSDGGWIAGLLAACFLFIWGEYLAYEHFDYWFSLRFLLPVWSIVMTGFAVLLTYPALPARPPTGLAVSVLALALGLHTLRVSVTMSAFDLHQGEQRYSAVGKLVRGLTERNSVIVSMQHSGSLRYYAGRTTLQYMHFDRDWLDRAVAWFRDHGIHPYAVLENWEVSEFRERFGPTNTIGRLEMSPMAEYGAGRVLVFDLLRAPGPTAPPGRVPESTAESGCILPVPPPRLVPQ